MYQIMQVAIPKKNVERSATGSQYDVVRGLPIGGAFFVPVNEGEDLNKCMRRVCGSCIRIAKDVDIRLTFRSLDSETATVTFGPVGVVDGDGGSRRPAGVGVWRVNGKYNHRTHKVAADEGTADVSF
jgi:hypothetical protein